MKAAIIGASEEALHTIEKAHENGLYVTALDGNPQAGGLKAADQSLIVDISREEDTIEAVKKSGADFLLTAPIGRYLTTVGAVNDALGLPGISREMAALCTDKYRFHQKLKDKGLRNCACYGIGGGEWEKEALFSRILSGEAPLHFPVILKPRYGSGSRGIHLAFSMEELHNGMKAVEEEPYVLEECIEGEEYGVDGAVTKEGFAMILLRRKENTPFPARQAVAYFSVLPQTPYWQQVFAYMKEVVSCLGLRECLLHADLIKGEDGLFVIELSARPSGHNLHNLFTPLCTGIDMAEEYIKYRMGRPYCFTPAATRPMMIHYFDMEGRVKEVPGREQAEAAIGKKLEAWCCRIEKGEKLGAVSNGHSLMGRGYFILEGENPEEMQKQAEIIKALFGI